MSTEIDIDYEHTGFYDNEFQILRDFGILEDLSGNLPAYSSDNQYYK